MIGTDVVLNLFILVPWRTVVDIDEVLVLPTGVAHARKGYLV